MLIKTLKWRVEFKTDEIVKEEFPQDVFGNLGHIYGKDKGGRPITYVVFCVYPDRQELKPNDSI